MSQPCGRLELLLVDARDLDSVLVREIVQFGTSRAVLVGAVAAGVSSGDARAELIGEGELIDFWFLSETDIWPFTRAVSFAGVNPGRAIFVSTSVMARERASDTGMMTSEPDIAILDRLLP
jgi:hypothetical protein